jgi:hypothetical protein
MRIELSIHSPLVWLMRVVSSMLEQSSATTGNCVMASPLAFQAGSTAAKTALRST